MLSQSLTNGISGERIFKSVIWRLLEKEKAKMIGKISVHTGPELVIKYSESRPTGLRPINTVIQFSLIGFVLVPVYP